MATFDCAVALTSSAFRRFGCNTALSDGGNHHMNALTFTCASSRRMLSLLLFLALAMGAASCGTYLPQDPDASRSLPIDEADASDDELSVPDDDDDTTDDDANEIDVPIDNNDLPPRKSGPAKPIPLSGTVAGVMDSSCSGAEYACDGCNVSAKIVTSIPNEVPTVKNLTGVTSNGSFNLNPNGSITENNMQATIEVFFAVVDPNVPDAVWCEDPWDENDITTVAADFTYAELPDQLPAEPTYNFRCYNP